MICLEDKQNILRILNALRDKNITNGEYHSREEDLNIIVESLLHMTIKNVSNNGKSDDQWYNDMIEAGTNLITEVNDILLSYGIYYEINSSKIYHNISIELKSLCPEKVVNIEFGGADDWL